MLKYSLGQLSKVLTANALYKSDTRSLTTASLHPNEDYYQELLQATDVNYQNITYWKHGKFESVSALAFVTIDLQRAQAETKKLLWMHRELIGFSNGRSKDAVNIQRTGEEKWRVTVPIFTRDQWDGYFWRADSDTVILLDMIRLFFDELEWFGMLDFVMDRDERYAQQ